MAVGDVIENTFEAFVDPDTGACIERLTPRGAVCHHMRFNQRHITRDSMFLLYSLELNDMRRICAMNLETGRAVQLTSGRDVADFSGVFSDDDRYVYYLQGNAIYRINLFTMLRERVYAAQKSWSIKTFSLSYEGDRLAVTEVTGTRMPSFLEASDWTAFSLSALAAPLSRIVVVDLRQGSAKPIVEQQQWIGQAQFRPHDPNTLLFCHEGPFDAIDARLWLVHADGSGLRCAREQPDNVIISQEFWWPDGTEFGYYYAEDHKEGSTSIRCMNPDTGEERVLAPCSPYVHCAVARSGRFVVGDSSGSIEPIHQLESEDGIDRPLPEGCTEADAGGDYIYLIDTLAQREFKLCHHGSTWSLAYGNTQDAHPHPYISDDGRWVFFTSDRDGRPAVYRVDAGRFTWETVGCEYGADEDSATWGVALTFAEA